MKIVYTGPHADGVLVYPDGREAIAEPGVPLEVPDAYGERLLRQARNWQPAPAPKPAAPADKQPGKTGGKD